MKQRWIGRMGVAFVALTVVAVGCGDDGSTTTSTPSATTATAAGPPQFAAGTAMATIQTKGKLSVGTKFDQPLFGLKNPTNGQVEGFDVEVAKIIARAIFGSDITNKVEYQEATSKVRETVIQDGKVDIVVATYTINDERKQVVSFAGPYYIAGQSILTLKKNKDIQTDADLDGKKVCTVAGSTPEATLIAKYPKTKVVPFSTYSDCIEPLRNGQVDAISTDNVILAGFAADNDDLEVRGEPFTEEPYGIGVKKDDTDFR
ncbi:MAG: glutamate ABC transporter substrate-binding protein, partial [Acidimicrobiales bacterium]